MIYILMGVSGCGKTTIGKMLAGKLGMPFYDADDYHSQQNIGKMKKGMPLTDDDRRPWLAALAGQIGRWNGSGGAVLACSALKDAYRQILSCGGKENVFFIHLEGKKSVIRSRMRKRDGHFFPEELLESQFRDLEIPADAMTVEIDNDPETICSAIMDGLSDLKSGFQNR